MRAALALGALLAAFLLLPSCEDSPTRARVTCGPAMCAPGEVCCNEGCGICVPPGGACIQLACVARECRSDADCATSSRHCGSCACRARHVADPEPLCPDTASDCRGSDPCQGLVARCDPASSSCVLR